ncbi:GNAT family N-acetyltransferase [Vibrio sp. SCSIO 43137]|uniref:GNAT family N-acetyltransferase n=1 Tax=Vibrio sp. SCSIO 43137 TaxID=3021011 RepID=UPI0023075860|nr:N-acetyltransferase [Vibrio sp. SCSIO 43137]WCE30800.1 N-acetyltransferase [Vibrio sp. SCSIO 43137]
MYEYKKITSNQIPIELLLEADPSEACIGRYLQGATCFATYLTGDNGEETIVAACVTNQSSDSDSVNEAEIYNIAVSPLHQKQGIGSTLLVYVLEQLKEQGFDRVILGTGTFGYQLTYYQRAGFRVEGVRKNYFIKHYPEPIYEHGLQHIDMLKLGIDL